MNICISSIGKLSLDLIKSLWHWFLPNSYEIYETCGPDSLVYIAEFAKKPELITEALKKFQATIKFKEAGVEIDQLIKNLNKANEGSENKEEFIDSFKALNEKLSEVKKLVVTDDLAQIHANLIKGCNESLDAHRNLYIEFIDGVSSPLTSKPFSFSEYNVTLKTYGSSKLLAVKLIKEFTGLNLKETKDIIDNLPKIIKYNVSKEASIQLRKNLNDIGATVSFNLSNKK